jgi:hypothetical protein
MSTTPAVFAQDLYNAFPEGVRGGPLAFQVSDGFAALDIRLTHAPDRVIALMRMPTLKVQLCFTAGNLAERKAMLRRMDLYMQRGGG